MSEQMLSQFPKPLLKDLLEGRWLPIIGAGFSLNARTPRGTQMPRWDDLGRKLAAEMEDYPYTGPIDAISAYAHEFSRAKLIERIRDILLIGKSRPGSAHLGFAKLKFDIVCTTNFDFLLEQAYEPDRYCQPILDEEQLSISTQDASIRLLKLHGDIHHPQRMIITEDDYDLFLERYPLIATYLASLMITRTPVFIGYSLDDPDFRMVWQTVSERLGQLRRQAYVLIVDGKQSELARYERRGVKPINLAGEKDRYGDILASAFNDLNEYVRENILPISLVTEEEPLQELSLPKDAPTRLCFFAIPFSLQAFYRDKVFPLVKRRGLVPMTAEDVIAPGDNVVAKIDALISRSSLIVADVSNKNILYELRLASSRLSPSNILVIGEEKRDFRLPTDLQGVQYTYVQRKKETLAEPDTFLIAIDRWLTETSDILTSTLKYEPIRLLDLNEYRAAVISAFTLLESTLRRALTSDEAIESKFASIQGLLSIAAKRNLIRTDPAEKIREWNKTRNALVHTGQTISATKSKQIVTGIMRIISDLESKNK